MTPIPSYPHRRAMIIGCPGGGKSTFGRALARATGLPLCHLDLLYWNPDRTTVPREVFLERQRAAIAREAWIIDGNYGSTLELRLEACDAVYFLDYPQEVCLEGIRARHGKARPDMPWVETEEDPDFLDFIRRFETESRPRILELLAAYPAKARYVFRSRSEADAYLAGLAEGCPAKKS